MKKRVNNQVNRADGALKRWPVLLLCGLLLQSANLAAQSGGGLQAASMLNLTGVPSGAVPLEIYRVQREVQHALPSGASIMDYDDVDKAYMEPVYSDERYLYAEDSNNNRITVRQVVDPASQFNPQTLPHSYSVLYRDTFRLYSDVGAVLFTVPLGDYPAVPLDTTGLGAAGPAPDTLPNGSVRIIAGQREIIMDKSEGIVFLNTYDSLSQWISRQALQYDPDTSAPRMPLYRLTVERKTAPSGDCVFSVETERYSEYGIWGTGLRNTQADPVTYAAPGKLVLSPNPVEDLLRIQLPDTGAEVKVTIYALDGAVVQERRQAGGTVWEADLSGLAPGVYLVRAQAGGQYWIEKVIRR